MSTTKKNGNSNGNHSKATHPNVDPVYDLPLIGPLVKEADALRTRLQGPELTRKEAELLRIEARALRHLANYLETRALQLDRHLKEKEAKPRVTKVRVEQ